MQNQMENNVKLIYHWFKFWYSAFVWPCPEQLNIFYSPIFLLTKNLMKEFFFLNDCSSYGSHWLWCIIFLKKSGVHKNWFFDTSGNLEEDITKLNNKLKMKNTCHMLLQQMTWCTQLHKNVQSIFLHEKFRKTTTNYLSIKYDSGP